MQKQLFGKITDGKLATSSMQGLGYKPVAYAAIPKEFNQLTQYIIQSASIDGKDAITCGIEVKELPVEIIGESKNV